MLAQVQVFLVFGVLLGSLVPSYSKSYVSVHIPLSLQNVNRSGEEHVTAGYGISQPQGSIASYVYAIEHDLCSPWNSRNGTGGFPQHEGGMKSPFMLMVSPSTMCTTVTQARRAQENGAAAVIVAHEVCRCSDKECTDAFGPDCVTEDPVLVNDGSAGDVTIPSFLLYRVKAHAILEELRKNQSVLMEFTWGLKDDAVDQQPPAVHYSIWTTAHDPLLDLDTYQNFKTIATALAPHGANFQPRYSILSGERFHCNQQIDTNGPCGQLCTNHGRYCALAGYALSGNAIVTETLRRLCVWQDFGTKDPAHYWDYILNHVQHCSDPGQYADVSCYTKALTDAKVDSVVVDQCMGDSGGLDADQVNLLLDSQLKQQTHSGVVVVPALVVENRTLEEPTPFHLWEGLCRRFWSRNLTTTPNVCFTCGACPNVIGCLEAGHCVDFAKPIEPPAKKERKRHGGWTAFFWIVSIVGGMGAAFYYYKKRQENEGVRGSVLSNYFQLSGEEM